MFERFTDRARRVVVLAQEEARMLNHNYIGTEHILLGLIHEGEGVAAKALESLSISLEAVRSQVEEIIGQGQQAPSGHIPFTPAGFNAMGAALMRRCTALRLGAAKVIVLDCDNTLWGGVCGEDGPSGVRTDGPWAALQAFMVECQARGQLLCLCSKNAEADVMATFAQQPDMPLQLRHIAAWRINWQRKSENLRALAAELNLGLDSFIFVDDNPAERELVREFLPMVAVPEMPEDTADYVRTLEEQYDQQRGRPPEEPLPSAGDILGDLEQFLREQRGEDDHSSA